MRDFGKKEIKVNNIKADVMKSDEEVDLAVLRVTEKLRKTPLKLSTTLAKLDKPFTIAGFYNFDGRNRALKRIHGKLGESVPLIKGHDTIQLWSLELDDENVLRPGYSGSPVILKTSGYGEYVLGIVSHQVMDQEGAAISIDNLEKIWPEIPSNLITQPVFQRSNLPQAVISVISPYNISTLEQGLTEALFSNLPSQSQVEKISVPALPKDVKENQGYLDAIETYWQHQAEREQKSINSPELAEQFDVQELEERKEFSKQLLQLLGEWQTKLNKSKLESNKSKLAEDTTQGYSASEQNETDRILRQEQYRLLILASLPEISEGCPALADLRLEVRRGDVSEFISKYYPPIEVTDLSIPLSLVEFCRYYFKDSIWDINIERIHNILDSIPTVMIYSMITDREVNFRIVFWGINNNIFIKKFCILWNWKNAYDRLKVDEGETDAIQTVRKTIIMVYQLLTAFIVDWYYLNVNPIYAPHLLQIESKFPKEWIKPCKKILQRIYHFNQSVLYYDRGIKLVEMADYKQAIRIFEKALEFRPDFLKAMIKRGVMEYYLERYDQAIKDLDKHPDSSEAWLYKGLSKMALEYDKEAIDCFKKATKLELNNQNRDERYTLIVEKIYSHQFSKYLNEFSSIESICKQAKVVCNIIHHLNFEVGFVQDLKYDHHVTFYITCWIKINVKNHYLKDKSAEEIAKIVTDYILKNRAFPQLRDYQREVDEIYKEKFENIKNESHLKDICEQAKEAYKTIEKLNCEKKLWDRRKFDHILLFLMAGWIKDNLKNQNTIIAKSELSQEILAERITNYILIDRDS